jgi:hypothetical protein
MKILQAPLDALSAGDIDQLCADQVSEGTEIEFKSDLPTRDGSSDAWHRGGPIGEFARNQIANEIVAFANTFGGAVCVGIAETDDHPSRAAGPTPLPRVHELARRLRQSIYDIVDPPLPMLEVIGIDYGPEGHGVVLLRVPTSRRRPHRQAVSRDVFVRRSDETAKVTMREIQELTIQSVNEAGRIEAAIAERRSAFLQQDLHFLAVAGARGTGFQFFALPTTPIELGRIAGRPGLVNLSYNVTVDSEAGQTRCAWPFAIVSWKPGLRSIVATGEMNGRYLRYTLNTSAACELSFATAAPDERPGLFAGWLIGGLGYLLAWIERIRSEAGVSVEFALAARLTVINGPISLMRYGAGDFSSGSFAETLPNGVHDFPIMSVGAADEFPSLLQQFDEDLWNLAGRHFPGELPVFKIVLQP